MGSFLEDPWTGEVLLRYAPRRRPSTCTVSVPNCPAEHRNRYTCAALWLAGFERKHRVFQYPRAELNCRPTV